MLALELLTKVVDKSVIKVLTTEVGITSSSLDLENTLFNSQKGNIESASTKIKDEDVALASNLLIETVCNAAAVGSLIIRSTFKPEMVPASLVA